MDLPNLRGFRRPKSMVSANVVARTGKLPTHSRYHSWHEIANRAISPEYFPNFSKHWHMPPQVSQAGAIRAFFLAG
jgi:hypothetical protein